MWPQRILEAMYEHPGVIALFEADEAGGKFLLHALCQEHKVAWLTLKPGTRDEIKLGNLLATTINDVLDPRKSLLGQGVSYKYTIEQFRPYTTVPGRFFLVVDGAEHHPDFVQEVMSLHGDGCKVMLNFGTSWTNMKLPEPVLRLTPLELRMCRQEVLNLERGFVSDQVRQELWDIFVGKPLPTFARLAEVQGLPFQVPSPAPTFSDLAEAAKPEFVLKKLLATNEYQQAFFFAVRRYPEELPGILERVGYTFFNSGGFENMFNALCNLEERYKTSDEVVFWLAVSAQQVDKLSMVRNEVFAYCEEHDHPEALAYCTFHAGHLPVALRRTLYERAGASPKRGFYTALYRYHLDTNQDLHQASVRAALEIARKNNEPSQLWESLFELAVCTIEAANLHEAENYLSEALELWAVSPRKDEFYRLGLVNGRLYVAMLLGRREVETSAFLDLPIALLNREHKRIGEVVATTQVELLVWQQNLERAELIARQAHEAGHFRGGSAETLALVLRECGKMDEAKTVLKASARSATDPRVQKRLELLTAMSTVTTNSEEALKYAERYFADTDQSLYLRVESIGMAVLYLYLLEQETGKLQLNHIPEPVIAMMRAVDAQAYRIFITPFAMYQLIIERIKEALDAHGNNLFLEVLGPTPTVYLNGNRLFLAQREIEVLFILSVLDRPLTYAELHTLLYPDGMAKSGTVRKLLHRLRKAVPISSELVAELPVQSDYIALRSWLEGAPGSKAPRNYPQLLPESDAPFIEDLRHELDEAMRRRILDLNDLEVALSLITAIDDLNLLEQLEAMIDTGDRQHALLQARIATLQASYLPN